MVATLRFELICFLENIEETTSLFPGNAGFFDTWSFVVLYMEGVTRYLRVYVHLSCPDFFIPTTLDSCFGRIPTPHDAVIDITKCGLWSLLGSQTYQYDQVLTAHTGVRDYVTQRRGRLCVILTHVMATPYRHRPLKGRDKRSKNQKETSCGAGLRPHKEATSTSSFQSAFCAVRDYS